MLAAFRVDGVRCTYAVRRRLVYARQNGWRGRALSGWRSDEQQLAAAARFAAQLGRPVEAVYPHGPLASNHCGTAWPKGAVDVTDPDGLERAMEQWTREGRRRPLLGNGYALPFDRAHFSFNGR